MTRDSEREGKIARLANSGDHTGRRQYLKWMATAGITSTGLTGAGAAPARAEGPSITEVTIDDVTTDEVTAPDGVAANVDVTFTWETDTNWGDIDVRSTITVGSLDEPLIQRTFVYEMDNESATGTRTETIAVPAYPSKGRHDLTVRVQEPIGNEWGEGQQRTMEDAVIIGNFDDKIWPSVSDAEDGTCTPADGPDKPATGEGAADWFAYGGCGQRKRYDVVPGEEYEIHASTNGSRLTDAAYQIEELVVEPDGGAHWVIQETFEDPLGSYDEKSIIYTPESSTIQIRNIDRGPGIGFYVEVFGPVPSTTDVKLQIEDVRPVQVVFETGLGGDDRLDLVTGKETAVLVYPGGENLSELSGDVTFEVLSEDDSDALTDTEPVTLSAEEYIELAENDDFYALTGQASGTGDKEVRVQLQTMDEKTVDIPDEPISVPVTNRRTGGLDLRFYRDEGKSRLGRSDLDPVDKDVYDEHVEMATKHIQGTYPVAEDNYVSEAAGTFEANALEQGNYKLSATLADLEEKAWHDSSNNNDQVIAVGIMSQDTRDYINWHAGSDFGAGITMAEDHRLPGISSSNAVLVQAKYWTTVAHELGHQFGMHNDKEEYNYDEYEDERNTPGCTVSGHECGFGYFVLENEYIDGRKAYMEGGLASERIIGGWPNNTIDYPGDFADYDHTFAELAEVSDLIENEGGSASRLETSTAEQILYLKGEIAQDGTVETSEWHFFEDATPSPTAGDYAVIGRNGNNETVVEKPFNVSFTACTLAESGLEELEAGPFSFAMEYPTEVETVEFQENEETLETFDPREKLLRGAIDSIPDTGFKQSKAVDQRRTALHNKIDAIEQMLNADNTQGAVQKLQNDVRPTIDRWLQDDYEADRPIEVTKGTVLATIDDTIDRLNS